MPLRTSSLRNGNELTQIVFSCLSDHKTSFGGLPGKGCRLNICTYLVPSWNLTKTLAELRFLQMCKPTKRKGTETWKLEVDEQRLSRPEKNKSFLRSGNSKLHQRSLRTSRTVSFWQWRQRWLTGWVQSLLHREPNSHLWVVLRLPWPYPGRQVNRGSVNYKASAQLRMSLSCRKQGLW